MGCSTPGFPVHHYLSVPVHWVADAIQPSHPLPPSSPFAFSLSQHQGLFQWVICLHQVARVLELQYQPVQWIFRLISLRIDRLDLLDVQGTLKSLLQHHSWKASILQRSAFFMVQFSYYYKWLLMAVRLWRAHSQLHSCCGPGCCVDWVCRWRGMRYSPSFAQVGGFPWASASLYSWPSPPPAVLNGPLLQPPRQWALPTLLSLTGTVGNLVLGIQGSDPWIQPIADGVDFSIQHGLNLWMWSPWIEHPRILVSTGDSGVHPVGDTKGTCICIFFFKQTFPKGASFRSFSSVFSPLSVLSSPMTSTLISALMTITCPGPCSEFQTLISSCTQVFQRLLINSSYSHIVTVHFVF